MFAETYDKLIELNEHLVHYVDEADAAQTKKPHATARTILIPQTSLLP